MNALTRSLPDLCLVSPDQWQEFSPRDGRPILYLALPNGINREAELPEARHYTSVSGNVAG